LFRSALLISSPLRDYSGNLKPLRGPDVLAQEIVEDFEAVLEQFAQSSPTCAGEMRQEKAQ
jgi:hypothetical protein